MLTTGRPVTARTPTSSGRQISRHTGNDGDTRYIKGATSNTTTREPATVGMPLARNNGNFTNSNRMP